jgi:hypothetical protein
MRLTRQGIRDLNAVGHNGHRNHGFRCRHFFGGPSVVVGHTWELDPFDGEAYQAEVYGKRCVWCGLTRDEA